MRRHRRHGLGDPDLAALDFTGFRKTYGVLDKWSLVATYNFEQSTVEGLRFDPNHAPESLKTLYHEDTHVIQALATNYGYYCHLVREFQLTRTRRIARELRTLGIPLRPPLLALIHALPRKPRYDKVRGDLELWYLAEVVMLLWEHGAQHYVDLVRRTPRDRRRAPEMVAKIAGLGPVNQFRLLNAYLHDFCQVTARADLAPCTPQQMWQSVAPLSAADREEELTAFLFNESFHWDSVVVAESGAKVAEYWRQEGHTTTRIVEPYQHACLDGSEPDLMIAEAAHYLGLEDLREFTLTFSVLADLALNGPMLPHHGEMSANCTRAWDLFPVARLRRLVHTAAHSIEPVRDLREDYERYVSQACEACEWPTPFELARATRPVIPEGSKDLTTDLYRTSLRWRHDVPWVFQNLDLRTGGPLPYGLQEVVDQFTPVIRQFDDVTIVAGTLSKLLDWTATSLSRWWWRKALLSPDMTIPLPFNPGPDLLAYIQDQMTAFSEMMGIVDPPTVILPADRPARPLLAAAEPPTERRPESIPGPRPPPRGEASQLHTTYVLLSAACRGNAHAQTLLEARLVRSEQVPHLVVLSGRLRKIIDGERDPDVLSRYLSDVDRMIVTAALETLDDTSDREPMPPLGPLMEGIMAAARYGRDRTGRSPDHHLMLWTFAELDEMGAQDDDAALFDAQVRRLFAGDDELDWNGLGDTFTAVLWVILDRLARPT